MTIQYKNAGINLSGTGTVSVLTSPTTARCLVKQIQVDNSSGSPVSLSVQVTDTSATATFAISRKAVAANTVENIIQETKLSCEYVSLINIINNDRRKAKA